MQVLMALKRKEGEKQALQIKKMQFLIKISNICNSCSNNNNYNNNINNSNFNKNSNNNTYSNYNINCSNLSNKRILWREIIRMEIVLILSLINQLISVKQGELKMKKRKNRMNNNLIKKMLMELILMGPCQIQRKKEVQLKII